MALGSWYHTFATANNKTNDVASSTPVVTGMSNLGEHGTGDLYNQVFAAYKSQVQNSTYTRRWGRRRPRMMGLQRRRKIQNCVCEFFQKPMQKAITNSIATSTTGNSCQFF